MNHYIVENPEFLANNAWIRQMRIYTKEEAEHRVQEGEVIYELVPQS